jgi:uncharacterized membrane protein YgcG
VGIKDFFISLRKQNSMDFYLTKLRAMLVRRYGEQEYYTHQQVKSAAAAVNAPAADLSYAYCMFCDESNFNEIHAATGANCNYITMRQEVALTHFHGNAHFTAADINTHVASRYASSARGGNHGGLGTHSGHGGHGGHGGFDGGGGGHGH